MLISLLFFTMVSSLFVPSNCYEIGEKVYFDLELSEHLFSEFIVKYNKQYTEEEYAYRLTIFKENLKKINELNKQHDKTVFGISHFSDMTKEEFKSYASCLDLHSQLDDIEHIDLSDKEINVPDSLDYRTQNLVTPVKDQGCCGSCYIFCAIGEIEGQYAKKHALTSLSEQYPLDCNKNFTCKGGDPLDVLKWVATTEGDLTSKDYPCYYFKLPCRANASLGVAKVKSSKQLASKDDESLKQLLVEHGPLGIAIIVNDNFKAYKGGIINPKCNASEELNHGVVLVGYGKDGDDSYWLIKNSWDSDWGEKGYVRLDMKAIECGVGQYIVTSEVL